MNKSSPSISTNMVSQLFFKLLPVQVAIVAMGSINSIVDGVVAARFIDASTVGVIGLYYTMLRVLEATGAILLGGVSVLSGRYLGAGKVKETRSVCSLGSTCALIIGVFLTLASFIAPRTIADLLGADAQLMDALATYTKGYAIGIIPQLLAQQYAVALQLERQDKRGQIGVFVMIALNVVLDILFVAVLHMGVWGLALATSLANWAYFVVLASYYLHGKSKMAPNVRYASWQNLPEVLKIGFPNALLVICLAGRSLIVNRLLLTYGGSDGLASLSAFNMICGLIIALALGAGAVIRILSSVFIGEENKEDISALMRTVFTKVLVMVVGIAVLVLFIAPLLTSIFFTDKDSHVYHLTHQLFIIYSFCIPAVLVCIAITNYCQALGHRRYVVIASLMDGFFGFVIPSFILAPFLGAFGVWLAFPISLSLTLLVGIAHAVVYLGHFPRSWEECLLLPKSFGSGDHLVLFLENMEQVTKTAEEVQAFCTAHGMPAKIASHAGLCLEELAGNVVRHGFSADKKPHWIEVRSAFLSDPKRVLLRIKDNCIPFNPQEWHDMTVSTDPCANVGIRLVYALANKIEYQNLLGLNVLSVTIEKRKSPSPDEARASQGKGTAS